MFLYIVSLDWFVCQEILMVCAYKTNYFGVIKPQGVLHQQTVCSLPVGR